MEEISLNNSERCHLQEITVHPLYEKVCAVSLYQFFYFVVVYEN
jgi:hypothetical protein